MITNIDKPNNLPDKPKVWFGEGALGLLHTLPMPGKKALIVTSNGKSMQANGALDRTIRELAQAGAGYAVFNGIATNPTKESVEEGAQKAIAEHCDFIVALGGGSVLDAAKTMAMLATNPADLWDYAQSGTGKRMKPNNDFLPWIAIPSTAGTGSEVDAVGVISNLGSKEKIGIFSDFAVYALIDPTLTYSIPPRLTAFQGFDALFHSLEGHISRKGNPDADKVQKEAIVNVGRYLSRVCRDGNDAEARQGMAYASCMSGYSMVASSCTGEHAIEHAMSAFHEQLPHGAGLIMISKAFFETIINQHVADARFVEMAQWLGKTDAQKPEAFLDALVELQKQCGVDELRMSDYGISPDEFDAMADNALNVTQRLTSQDLQPLSHDEIVEILRKSYR